MENTIFVHTMMISYNCQHHELFVADLSGDGHLHSYDRLSVSHMLFCFKLDTMTKCKLVSFMMTLIWQQAYAFRLGTGGESWLIAELAHLEYINFRPTPSQNRL